VGYYCEPNLCHLLITNVGSDPVSVSGDLCGVLDGAVYIGDNYVSETLNPQITYEVDFSFLGPYEGDKLSKIWLGDCADESSAELKWTNLSVATSSSSDSGSDGVSSSSGSTDSGSSGGSSNQTPTSSAPTASSEPTSSNAPAAPSENELLNAWLGTVQVIGVSEESPISRQKVVTVNLSYDPFPLTRNMSLYHSLHNSSTGEMLSAFLETSWTAKPGETSGSIRTPVWISTYDPVSQFTIRLRQAHYDPTLIELLAIK
jgi:hypothetical protein